MAIGGFKKKLPISAAMRPGGFGTVPPPKAGKSADIAMNMAKEAPKAPKAPGFTAGPKMPGMPKMPKFK